MSKGDITRLNAMYECNKKVKRKNLELTEKSATSNEDKTANIELSGVPRTTMMIGDLILPQQQYDYHFTKSGYKRFGVSDPTKRWPNGRVSVVIDEEAKFSSGFIKKIHKAMEDIMKVSCVTFDWKTKPKEFFVKVVRGDSGVCASYVRSFF